MTRARPGGDRLERRRAIGQAGYITPRTRAADGNRWAEHGNPLGVKGVGEFESGAQPDPAVLASAIDDALGTRGRYIVGAGRSQQREVGR
jgi:hypothetical protein